MNKLSLNEKLLLLRKQRNLTQPQMADICRTTQATVSKWESGEFVPGIDSLKDITIKFEIDFNIFLPTFTGEINFKKSKDINPSLSRFR